MPGIAYNPQEFDVVSGPETQAPAVTFNPDEFDVVSEGEKSWTERIGEKLRVPARIPGEFANLFGATATDMLASTGRALNEHSAAVNRAQSDLMYELGTRFPGKIADAYNERSVQAGSLSLQQGAQATELAGVARAAREGGAEAIPQDAGWGERAIVQGLSSAAVSVPAVLAAGPVGGAAVLGVGTGMSRRSELLDAGKSQAEANTSGLALGSLEALTEFMPGKALFAAAKGSTPLYKELLKFVATELPGENITTIAQVADDYRLGLRDDVTVQDLLEAARDTTAATVVGGGAQLSVGGMLRAARNRANARAEERAKGGPEVPPQPPIPDAQPPTMPPIEEPPVSNPETAGPQGAAPQAASEPPYIPPGVEPGDVQIPEGPDVVRQAGVSPTGERFDPALFDVVQEAADPPPAAPEVPRAPQDPTATPDTVIPPQAPAGATAGPAGATTAVRFGQAERLFEKPPVPVTEVDPTPFKTAKEAETFGMVALRGVIRNADTGWDIGVGRSGIEKATSSSGRAGSVHLRALRGIKQLLERAVLVESHPDRKTQGFVAIHRLYAPLRLGGKLYRAKLTVREDGQGHHFYDHAHSEIERADVHSEGSQKDATAGAATVGVTSTALGPSAQAVSIADLLAGQVRDHDGLPFVPETRSADRQDPPDRPQQPRQPATDPDIEASSGPPVERAAGAAYVSMYQSAGAPAQPVPFTVAGRAHQPQPKAEPIRREHIMEEFQRLFGVKVYQGKPFKFGEALGIHRPKTGEVRIKKKNDLEVTAHEVWHWIDRKFPTIRKLYHEPRFRGQLTSVSYDATKLSEGFAEFGRLFMTKETEAVAKAPEFYDAFVEEAKRLGIYDKLARVQHKMHEWYLQGAEARALSKIGHKPPGISQRLDILTDRWGDRAIQWGVDRMHSVKMVEREITGGVGTVYEGVRLLAGARNVANQFVNYGTLAWGRNGDLEFSGEGLRQIFEPVGEHLDDCMAYFVGRRAKELAGYKKENLFSKDEIDALIARGTNSPRAAEIRTAFYKYQEYTKRLMDFAEQSGIVSAETRAIWQAMYQNYVPFYRVAESLGDDTFDQSGRRAVGSVFKRLTGGSANLNDTLENITLNTALIVHASLKNMAKRQLFKTIESSRAGQRWAVRVPTDTHVVNIQMRQVENTLRKLQDELAALAQKPNATAADKAMLLQISMAIKTLTGTQGPHGGSILSALQGQATFFTTGHPPNIEEVDSVLVNGERIWFQIGDPMLWRTLKEINSPRALTLLEKAVGLPKRVLTRGVTVTPEFQVSNLLRDGFQAYTLSKGGQWPVADSIAAFNDILTESEHYRDFLANGGGFGNSVNDETKRLRLNLHRLDRHHLLDTPAKIADFWDQWGQSFELATRLAEYKRMRAKGATKRQAAYAGREISSDFAMRGSSELVRFVTNTVPFTGARLQGLYRLEREIFEKNGRQGWGGEHAIRFATRSLIGITLPSLLLYALNKDDDDYSRLPEETRMLFWAFKIPGTDNFALIPKPFEVGALFSTIPEYLWRSMEERHPKALMDAALFTLANTFAFDPEPQIVKPLIDVFYRNKYWTGAPIVPRSLENVEAEEQFRPWTAQSMVAIGKAFGVSPLKLEALLNGYLGTIGQYAIMASDALVTTPGAGEDPASKLSTLPLFRRFLREAPYRRTSYETRFYELADQVTRVVATAGKLRREGRGDDLGEYLGVTERQQLFAMSRLSTSVSNRSRDIDAAMRAIRRDPLMSGEEKTRRMDELQAAQNTLFESAMKHLDANTLAEYRDALEAHAP